MKEENVEAIPDSFYCGITGKVLPNLFGCKNLFSLSKYDEVVIDNHRPDLKGKGIAWWVVITVFNDFGVETETIAIPAELQTEMQSINTEEELMEIANGRLSIYLNKEYWMFGEWYVKTGSRLSDPLDARKDQSCNKSLYELIKQHNAIVEAVGYKLNKVDNNEEMK